jgi:hypothetical protein
LGEVKIREGRREGIAKQGQRISNPHPLTQEPDPPPIW